jgi:hypothetical protein
MTHLRTVRPEAAKLARRKFQQSAPALTPEQQAKARAMSGDMLIRLCRAGGLSVNAMLEAKLTSSGRCASCGALRRSA